MSKQTTIHITSEDISINLITESNITYDIVQRIEKHLNALINENLAHDLRGRITSINMSLFMLERVITPEAYPRYNLLKTQIDDLSQMIEAITE